jgi:hypothetical protein
LADSRRGPISTTFRFIFPKVNPQVSYRIAAFAIVLAFTPSWRAPVGGVARAGRKETMMIQPQIIICHDSLAIHAGASKWVTRQSVAAREDHGVLRFSFILEMDIAV